jgi:hypothetical protein
MTFTKMDDLGNRYARRNGRWVKIHKQTKGGYTVVCGWEGEIKAPPHGVTINHRSLAWAKASADDWLDNH